MIRKLICCCVFPVLCLSAGYSYAESTAIQYLSGIDKDNTIQWDFKVNGGRNSNQWKKIAVPSNWEMQGFGTYRYWSDWQPDKAPDSEAIYRTSFTLPNDWKEKDISIVFGGVMTDAEVKINDKLVGVHRGGFYEFSFPVKEFVNQDGINQLEVKVNRFSVDESINRAERSADFWLFCGIYRPVWLEAKPKQHIANLRVNTSYKGELTLATELKYINADQLRVELQTLEGKRVGKPYQKNIEGNNQLLDIQFQNIIPWSAENPQRYNLIVELMKGKKSLHSVKQTIGFRSVELRKGDGIYVNNKKIKLKGANRHAFWPDSGRTTSKTISYQDARLIKEMNMNAVRVAHYPPDRHFLEVTDELGIYVINELTGWQQSYSTAAGAPLVKELIARDHNNPSVILWANGNEGGWNTELDDDFHQWDLQKRPVIHPWGLFNGINTAHYEPLNCCPGRLFDGEDVFMPTEFLHGLYDGGAGAGLNDWWNKMQANSLSAGGFIWSLVDEGIVRQDLNGKIDVAGNRAPDGVLGPYREKEGSFFAIKEIWSPVYIPVAEQEILAESFNGTFDIENRYDFTNLNSIEFRWQLVTFPGIFTADNKFNIMSEGKIQGPSLAPGHKGSLQVQLPQNWRDAEAFYLSAINAKGEVIYTWSWMLAGPMQYVNNLTQTIAPDAKVDIQETSTDYIAQSLNLRLVVNKADGRLKTLERNNKKLSLQNGPRLIGPESSLKKSAIQKGEQSASINFEFNGPLRKIEWQLLANDVIKLTYAYQMPGGSRAEYLGVSFDYPETQVKSMRWLGKGPYRVWKNRTKGVEYGVWEKNYNDTITGLSWNYPEFKGFHDHIYWAQLATTELPLTMVIKDNNIALRLLTPDQAQGKDQDPLTTKVEFPAGDISFLHAYAPIGTKFHAAADHGPEGEPHYVPRLGQWYQTEIYLYIGE
jgi:beta-galactosidase/beta-glucuronidase